MKLQLGDGGLAMTNLDIHNLERDLIRSIERLKSDYYSIRENNRVIILKFVDYLVANSYSSSRISRYLTILPQFSNWLDKDFVKVEKSDMLRVFKFVERRGYTAHTKITYKGAVKRFFKWLLGDDDFYPPCVSWIKYSTAKLERLPDELLTVKEISELIKCANSIRDKALISLLWETGCRIGELGNLKIKHVTFDEYGGLLRVNGKTGTRRVRFVNSVPYISAYINFHPKRDDSDSPLWLTNSLNLMGYKVIRKQLLKAAKRAGIKKKVNPHAFRHARATLMSQHFTDAQMKEYFGWSQSSKMASVYIHLSGRDVDNALLEFYGLKAKSKKLTQEKELPVICNCGASNPVEAKFCLQCGQRLIKESEAIGIEQLAKLLQDKDLQKLLKKKLQEGMTQ